MLCREEREKNVGTEMNIISNAHATVTVHIYTVTVAIVHKCTILHPLMWVFFCSNCVKLVPFSILHNYTSTDVIALRVHFGITYLTETEIFLLKVL